LLRVLRRVPRPAGVAVVAALAAGASLLSLQAVWGAITPDPTLFVTQASAALLLAALVVAVRCAGAVTGERERQSWESLLLTPLDGPTYLRGKLLGVRDAVAPYFLAYAVPALLASLLGGGVPVVATVCGLVLAWPVIYYAAACGLRASVSAPSTWRSMVTAVFTVYVTGALVSFAVSVGVGAMFLYLNALLDADTDPLLGPLFRVLHPLANSIACAVALLALGNAQMQQAERRALLTMPKDQFLTVFGSNGTARRRRWRRSRRLFR
jgi:hypothetical protein